MTANNLTPSKIRKRWQSASRDDRQQLIVDVALDLLRRKTITAVTIRGVADRLGVGAMTLYTYVDGYNGLKRLMIHQGFQLMRDSCERHSTLDGPEKWRGGSRAYVQFAIDNPNLYKLMFDLPLGDDPADQQLLHGEFQPMFDRISEQLAHLNLPRDEHEKTVRKAAGQFWITLHGLASLAIAGRLGVLHSDIDHLLDDLLQKVSPS